MARIMVTIPDELLAMIDQAAKVELRNRSEFLREAARVYLQQSQTGIGDVSKVGEAERGVMAERNYSWQELVKQPRKWGDPLTMAETTVVYQATPQPPAPALFAEYDSLSMQEKQSITSSLVRYMLNAGFGSVTDEVLTMRMNDIFSELERQGPGKRNKADDLLSRITNAEKSLLVKRYVQKLSGEIPGIERTPGVIGGDACIAGTRIPVWALVQYRKLGASDIQLLQMYPTLQAGDLVNAWAYYNAHTREIEQQIFENETA